MCPKPVTTSAEGAYQSAASTAEDLRYTRRRYLHKEHIRAAIAQVVNALLEATATCASESKKFHAVDQNLLTQ